MPITATDLIAPTGELADSLLAGIGAARVPVVADPTAVAQGYADVGNSMVATWGDAVRAARGASALAYAKAFGERAQQINTAANALSAGDVSRSYSVGQAKELQALANRWQAVFDAALSEEAAGDVEPAPLPPVSRSTPVTVTW